MTHEHEIVPLHQVREDIKMTKRAIHELRHNIYPHLKGRLPWKFLPFWAFLWGLIIYQPQYVYITSFGTVWFLLEFLKACAMALGCKGHINEGEQRLIGLNEYLNEHYPNEKE